jgi:hypothetical protein
LLADLLGPIGWLSCILATTVIPADAKGFEHFSFDGLTTMIFALLPIAVDDGTGLCASTA